MLELEGVRVARGGVEILGGIDLSVREGEVVALLGANGAGKTTLLRAVSGLEPEVRGALRFEGRSLVGLRPHRIVGLGIGHAPERGHLFPSMTVRDHLLLGAWTRSRDRGGVARDREWIGALFPVLRERERQRAGTLSGGEQRMLAIARSLLSRPRLLLLDEPLLGLGPRVAAGLLDAVGEVRRHGTAILLAEQNATASLAAADRGVVLAGGRVVLEGEAGALASDPALAGAYLGPSPSG